MSTKAGQPHNRIQEQLAQLAEMFAGYRPWRSYARAAIHRLRGELSSARSVLQQELHETRPGEHRAWLVLAPAYVEILLLCADPDAAVREARAILEHVRSLSLQRVCAVAGHRVLALALSARQEHEAAKAAMAQALVLARELEYGGLALAQLCEARARVYLSAGDVETCIQTLQELWPLIEHSEATTLVSRYELLREESEALSPGAKLPLISPVGRTATIESSSVFSEVRTVLSAAGSRKDRAAEALKLLLQDSGAHAGHLMLLDGSGLFAAAAINDKAASAPFVNQAQAYLNSRLDNATVVAKDARDDGTPTFVHGALKLTPVHIVSETNEGSLMAGIAMLAMNDNGQRVVRNELVRIIAHCLLAAGDTVAIAMDQ